MLRDEVMLQEIGVNWLLWRTAGMVEKDAGRKAP